QKSVYSSSVYQGLTVLKFRTNNVDSITVLARKHKEQRNQSKKYNEKGKLGYKHDVIMFFEINERKIQVGFLKVVGNAYINNDFFKNHDTEK
ncbi:11700_t:CDS:2, partial [Entrophospora sp. SA101]